MARLNTTLELHIEVLQGLQKVDAFRQDMFEPPEVDLHLNKQQDRFIDDLFGKEFEDRQIRLDYVRALIVKNHKLQVIEPTQASPLYEPGMIYAVLPPDYLYLVNDRSKLGLSQVFCADVTDVRSTEELQEHVSVLPFPLSTRTDPPFYNTFQIFKTEAAVEEAIYTAPTALTGYLTDPNAKYMVINNSLESMNRSLGTTTRVYWESYRGQYYQNSYIFVRDNADWTQVRAVAYNDDDPVTIDNETNAGFTQNDYQSPIFDPDQVEDESNIWVDNGMTEGDKLYDLPKNVYYQSSKQEPISAMSTDFIHVYDDKSFIIREVAIDYVRKPRQISLLLDQSCELTSASARANIVDKTVQYMKLLIENPAHREFLQDNLIKNQNSITNG